MKNNKNYQSPRLLGYFVIKLAQVCVVWGVVMLFSTQALLGQRLEAEKRIEKGRFTYYYEKCISDYVLNNGSRDSFHVIKGIYFKDCSACFLDFSKMMDTLYRFPTRYLKKNNLETLIELDLSEMSDSEIKAIFPHLKNVGSEWGRVSTATFSIGIDEDAIVDSFLVFALNCTIRTEEGTVINKFATILVVNSFGKLMKQFKNIDGDVYGPIVSNNGNLLTYHQTGNYDGIYEDEFVIVKVNSDKFYKVELPNKSSIGSEFIGNSLIIYFTEESCATTFSPRAIGFWDRQKNNLHYNCDNFLANEIPIKASIYEVIGSKGTVIKLDKFKNIKLNEKL